MKYRNLRIAWSAFFGILCLLLIALWVRSFRNHTDRPTPIYESGRFSVYSTHGSLFVVRVFVLRYNNMSSENNQTLHRFDSLDLFGFSNVRPHRTWTGFHFEYRSWTLWTAQIPFWFLTALAGVMTALPWVNRIAWRFSLRTLLIATTLVAVVLGLVVYFADRPPTAPQLDSD